LKTMGENANFFGDYQCSKTHLQSLSLILERKCDAAAVDSTVLGLFLEKNPHFKNDLHVLTSWGPLPAYPIVVNSHLSPLAEELIVQALSSMHQTVEGIDCLNKYRIVKFTPNSSLNYAFLSGQFVKKSNKNGVSSGTPVRKQDKEMRSNKLSLTKDQFESPYY